MTEMTEMTTCSPYTVRPLDASTWAAFAELVERNGSLEELPGVSHRRAYEEGPPPRPDWRISCVYVDKRHRRQGIARAALEGALEQIAQAGGGLVEAIPEATVGRTAQGRFLFNATVELFEQYGFQRVRQLGKHAWIVSRVLDPA